MPVVKEEKSVTLEEDVDVCCEWGEEIQFPTKFPWDHVYCDDWL